MQDTYIRCRGALEQEVGARAGLGERDHISNGLGFAQDRHEAVESYRSFSLGQLNSLHMKRTECNAPVRRGSASQRMQ